MSKGGRKQTQTQQTNNTTSTQLDPSMQRYMDFLRNTAMQGAGTILAGPNGIMPSMAPAQPVIANRPNFGSAYGGARFDERGGAETRGGVSSGPTVAPPGPSAPMSTPNITPGMPTSPTGNSWFTGPLTMTPGEMAEPFMNPYLTNVVDSVRGEFDHLRGQASRATDQAATSANAFGNSRAALLEGTRLGELDRAQASQVGNLMNAGYQDALGRGMQFADYQRRLTQEQLQEPIFRQMQAMGLLNMGMGGPFGSTTMQNGSSTMTIPRQGGSALGGAASGALAGSSIGGPVGGLIGGGIGLLGGIFG